MPRKKNLFLLTALLLTSVIVFLEIYPVESYDLWWHLKSAQVILGDGFPSTDIFSATTPAAPWFPFEWLAELSFYQVYLAGGLNALIVFKALVAGCTWGIICLALYKRGVSLPVILLAVATGFFLTRESWPLRPLIYSFFFFAAAASLIDSEKRNLLMIPLITLWANVHPSFYLGFLLVGLHYLGRQIDLCASEGRFTINMNLWKRFALLITGLFLASLIHPRPLQILVYPLKLISSKSFMLGISEWRPAPFYSEPLFYLLVVPVVLFALMRARKIGWSRTLPVLVFAAYALSARRHIPLFAIIASLNLPLANDDNKIAGWSLGSSCSCVLGLSLLLTAGFTNLDRVGRLGMAAGFFPEKAIQFIEKENIEGPMYNAYDWGGYLIWRLYPQIKTFIDGRNSSEELFLIDRTIREAQTGYQAVLDNYQINFILTSSSYFNSGRLFPLIEGLFFESDWRLVYQDEVALLFVRNNPANERIIKEYQLSKNRIFYQVIAEGKRRLELDPRLPQAYLTLGKAYLQLEDFSKAREAVEKALELEPNLGVAKNLLRLLDSLKL